MNSPVSDQPGTRAMFLAPAMSAIRQALAPGRFLLALCVVTTACAQGGLTFSGQTVPARKGFQRPVAPASGPAPFLTEAISWELDKFAKFSEQLVYPTKVKTDAPFCDVPFAVNVPFEVPFDGGAVRVFFDVNIVWDEPERMTVFNPPGSSPRPLFPENGGGWNFYQQGIYRLDGGALSDATAVWEVDSSESRPMTWQTAAPFPLLLNGAPPTPARGGSVTTRVDVNSPVATPKPRRPFTNARDEHGGFAAGRPLVLRSAAPGWYVLWFTLSPSLWAWPPKPLRADDTLRAKILVHYIVARRERLNGTGGYFYPVDLEVLWTGADKKPVIPIDPNLVRAHTVEIPLTLRRDGWVLVRADADRVSERNSWLDLKLPPRESRERVGVEVTGQVMLKAYGVTANYQSSIFERANTDDPFPRTPTRATKMTWEVTLPSEIPDGGVGQIVATGGVERQGGDAKFRDRKPHEYNEDYVYRWLNRPDKPKPDPHNVGSLLELVRSDDPGDKAGYVKDWGWKVGDPDGSRFWKLGGNGAPPRARDDQRYTIIAQPPKPEAANTWTKELLPILYQDLGPQHLFSVDVGPWRVKGYYRRKKDADKIVSGTPTIGAAKVADEKDEFWEWYPKYSRLLRKTDLEIGALEKQNGIDRELMQAARRTASRLLDAVQAANDPGSFSDWFASGGTRAAFTEEMIGRMTGRAGQANTEAFTLKTAILQRAEKMRAARAAVLAEIARVFPKFIDRHPELTLYEREQRALLEGIDIKVALGTGDLGLFQAVMAKAKAQPASLQPETLLALSQLQLENGDSIGALESLRIATRQQPENGDARDRLRNLECSVIKVALDKSQDAIAKARRYFYGYLSERGFGERDHPTPVRSVQVRSPFADHLPGVANGAWVSELRGPGLARYDAESAWAVFTTGVTGALSGLLGRAEQEARALDASERDMTAAFLGAHTILRLRMRGHTLAEIKALTTSQIQEEMQRGAPNALALTRERAQQLGLAIHQAFLLPELQALLSENSADLRKGSSLGYWNPKDVGNTWAEWVGDFSSPKNLVMMFLPMSIGSIGGRGAGIAYWSRAEAAFIQGATRTGYVDTGTMVVARMLQLDRALGAIGGTESGAKFIKLLERSQQYQESLGLFGQGGWTLGKMVAAMGAQGLAVHEAEQLGGPRAALMMECLLLFGGDTDLMIKFLDGARISRQAAWQAAKETVFTLEKQQRALLAVKEQAIEAAQVMEFRRLGKKAPPRQHPPPVEPRIESSPAGAAGGAGAGDPNIVGIGEIFPPPAGGGPAGKAGKIVTPPVHGGSATPKTPNAPLRGPVANHRQGLPNGQPGNDASIALAGAEEVIEQGSDNGALAAAQNLAGDLEGEINQLVERGQQLNKIADALEHAPPSGPLPERPLGSQRLPPRELGPYVYPPQPGELNETWLRAERALFAGQYEEAAELYELMLAEFARDAYAGKPLGVAALPPVMIKHRLQQARALRGTPPPQVDRAASAGIMRAIPDEEVAAILALPRGNPPPQGASGWIAPTQGADFMVKEVKLGGKLTSSPEELERMITAEVISAELASILGLAAPGTHVQARWIVGEGGRSEMQSASLIYRRIEGETLDKLKPEQLFHLRDQIAEHRVLATLLGDYDRKPDNYMLFNGVVHALDGGQGDIMARRAHLFGSKTHPATIAGFGGNDHWYADAFKNLNDPERAAVYQTIFLSEMSLTYQATERGIKNVEALLGQPAQRAAAKERLRAAFGRLHKDNPFFAGRPQGQIDFFLNKMADETLEAMELRLPATIEAMKSLNERNGIPLPPGVAPAKVLLGPLTRRRGELLPFQSEWRLAA